MDSEPFIQIKFFIAVFKSGRRRKNFNDERRCPFYSFFLDLLWVTEYRNVRLYDRIGIFIVFACAEENIERRNKDFGTFRWTKRNAWRNIALLLCAGARWKEQESCYKEFR
ncbi:hypothetical protein BCV54_16350 [Parageobacillus thermoglucosidasius]|nr:hypothetical protein BCV54_16350 [Parageobacillus thermoglucosidasius]